MIQGLGMKQSKVRISREWDTQEVDHHESTMYDHKSSELVIA